MQASTACQVLTHRLQGINAKYSPRGTGEHLSGSAGRDIQEPISESVAAVRTRTAGSAKALAGRRRQAVDPVCGDAAEAPT